MTPNPALNPAYCLALGLAAALERENFPQGWPHDLCRGAVLECTKGLKAPSPRVDRGTRWIVRAVIPQGDVHSVLLEDAQVPDLWVRLVATTASVGKNPSEFSLLAGKRVATFKLRRRSPFAVLPPGAETSAA